MAIVDLVMPKMGESIMEATILHWHKKEGDLVKEDEMVLEIATDKVDTEVPSSAEGEITEILFLENAVVPVGTVIARIKTSTNASSLEHNPTKSIASLPERNPTKETPGMQYSGAGQQGNAGFYSPLVLTIARNEGISLSELENIPGTGNEGRVTKRDILLYVATKKHGTLTTREVEIDQALPKSSRQISNISSAALYEGNVEILEMDRMRRLIAEHMVRSKSTSPHVTSFAEADVSSLVRWREGIRKEFEKRESEKLSFTPLFIEAIVKCIKKFPLMNSSVDGDRIIIKKDINIGMATALPGGNLIVPVIRNADQLNLVGLTRQVNALANSARNGKLKPDDTQGGTFTISNVGTFGSLMGTPIINQPQVAILAVGIIKKRPVVVETPQGDSIAIRHMMYLSMSYDHRIIDGSLGSTFLSAVAAELEHFNPEREF
ncbi:MAG TPA: dihydrolipoamide acetyltransferase family protein [Chitinophagaceae bacterium]|nr:dihydrolipoamide acetyltransferase family protein [Chitinophagaceae bacterium]